jgi:hypothetical protein
MLLSRFAMQAKRYMGVVNVTRMSTDQLYALDVILGAYASKDSALIALAKTVCKTLPIHGQLLNAIEHFIGEYIDQQTLPQAERYLHQFAHFIYNISTDGIAYRRAVSQFLKKVPQDALVFCTQLIRAFYPYWIAELSNEVSHQDWITFGNATKNRPHATISLLDLWEKAESELLSDNDLTLLNRYTNMMLENEMDEDAMDARLKMARILAVELRRKEARSQFDYRLTVQEIESAITKHDLKTFFVQVSRDFYYVWAANADASQRLAYSI